MRYQLRHGPAARRADDTVYVNLGVHAQRATCPTLLTLPRPGPRVDLAVQRMCGCQLRSVPVRNVTVSLVSGRATQIPTATVGAAELDLIVEHWSGRIAQVLPDRPDIVVLPELFDRPHVSDQPAARSLVGAEVEAFARAKGTHVRDALAELAAAHGTYITYPSYRVGEEGEIYNSLEILGRDGAVVATYDKIVPTLGEVAGFVHPGHKVMAAELDFGRVSAAICFDLNFVQVRNAVAKVKPDLVLFPSAYHGGFVQSQWALDCRAYFAGCVYPPNRSTIVNPAGTEVASTSTYDFLLSHTINLDYVVVHLGYNTEKLGRLKAAYGPDVLIEDPGLVGMVVVSSRTPDRTAQEMIDEFDIQDLDGYFADSTAHLEGVEIGIQEF